MKRLRYVRLSAGRRAAIWGIFLLAAVMGLMCVAVLHMKPSSPIWRRPASPIPSTASWSRRSMTLSAPGRWTTTIWVHLEKDQSGHVAAVRSDMAAFNRLQSRLQTASSSGLSEVSTRELEIPVGTLTGSSLLAGRGPCIRIRMQAVGSTTAKLRNAFTAAGINQTKHQILLDVTVQMSILLPGFRTSTQVSNEITVAETIIIASVPDTYTTSAPRRRKASSTLRTIL